jgi:hypothetical protein
VSLDPEFYPDRKDALIAEFESYLKDADLKLRFIAIEAINKATNAFPDGWPLECMTDSGSEWQARNM